MSSNADALPVPGGASAPARDAEVIALVGVAHATSHFFHLLLPPLYPWLMPHFGLGYAQAGLLMTVFFVVSGVGQALAGFLVDRIGARPVLFGGIALLGCSGLLLAVADSYAMLVGVALLAGLGNSIFHPADFTLLNRRVSAPRLGHAFGVHGLTGNLGWAAGTAVVAGVASLTGQWHLSGLAAAALAFGVLGVLVWRREVLDDRATQAVVAGAAGAGGKAEAPATGAPPAAAAAVRDAPFGFLGSAAVWLCFLFFLFATGAFGVLQNFGPAVLGEVHGLEKATAAFGLTTYLLGSAGGTVLGGFVAGRTTRNDAIVAVALGSAATLAVLLATAPLAPWLVLPVMALMGFGTGVAGPSRDLLVRRAATSRFGRASFGRVYGFVYSGLDLGLALSPIVFGPLLDRGAFVAALLGVAVLQVAALLSALRVGRAAAEA